MVSYATSSLKPLSSASPPPIPKTSPRDISSPIDIVLLFPLSLPLFSSYSGVSAAPSFLVHPRSSSERRRQEGYQPPGFSRFYTALNQPLSLSLSLYVSLSFHATILLRSRTPCHTPTRTQMTCCA